MRKHCKNLKNYLPLGATLSFSLFAGFILSSRNISAENGAATATVSVEAVCSMTGTVDSAHAATVSAGSYTEDIGTTNLQTFCGDDGGYAIYAVGYTGNTLGSTILKSSTGVSSDDIATGTATEGDVSNWAMKITPSGLNAQPTITNGFGAYHVVPSSYAKVAEYSSSTGSNYSNLTTTYAAYIAGFQAAGTYTSQVKYTLLHPSTADASCLTVACVTIQAGDGVSSVSVRKGSLTAAALTGTSVQVPAASGTKLYVTSTLASGYVFKEWANSANLGTISAAASGMVYTSTNGETTLTISGIYRGSAQILQEISASTCPSNSTTVYDNRDGRSYHIQKLADNHCWLQDNLNLGDTGSILVTTNDTHASGNVEILGNTTSPTVYTTAVNTASRTKTYSYGNGNSAVGVYYNFCAASAGTLCVVNDYSQQDAAYDVCPKGWRMPTGGSSSDYWNLYAAYSQNPTNFKNALHTALTGYFAANNGALSYQGTSGQFWSATHANVSQAYKMVVDSSTVGIMGLYEGRTGAMSVRCILQ